ncbi:MAG: NAD-dependent epimerase/dehydratase family protein [Gammaproteobacteria bacterium]|nr:NAD-dependent epimerase/dehydratase family protein [Gammaproteobacteria bacterium]
MIAKNDKIVITGAAGLVGQNLVLLLREKGYTNLMAIDKHTENLKILKQLNPDIEVIAADLSIPGTWQDSFARASEVLMLHAQITGLFSEDFRKNNIEATQYVIDAIKKHNIPHTVHISSSVVNSVANDDYTNTKKDQEKLVVDSGINCCVLRPTLMFGWFDPKHLGWLSRFMEKTPVFPIPGNGRYIRQPLYSRDFCRVIVAAMEQQKTGKNYDIVGMEEITYIDMIRLIKKLKKLSTKIICIPYHLFYYLLKFYALFSKKPPFTADQLKALTAGDHFVGIDFYKEFGVQATPLKDAFAEAYTDPKYSHIELGRTG